MAVQYIKEKSRKSGNYESGAITAKRVFQAKAEAGDTEATILAHASIPNVGSAHPSLGAWCQSVDWELDDNTVEWTVTANYSSELELAENPLNDPVQIDWDGEIYTETVFEDINGDAITNSAGDYFVDPTPTKERTHRIANVKANVASVPAWGLDFNDVVNNSNIVLDGATILAEKALLRRLRIGRVRTRNGTAYREITYELHVHKDGWKIRPMDVGFREIVSGSRAQIKNGNDEEEPTTPVPLDGFGNVLDNPTPSTVKFLEFDIHELVDLTVLPGITAA